MRSIAVVIAGAAFLFRAALPAGVNACTPIPVRERVLEADTIVGGRLLAWRVAPYLSGQISDRPVILGRFQVDRVYKGASSALIDIQIWGRVHQERRGDRLTWRWGPGDEPAAAEPSCPGDFPGDPTGRYMVIELYELGGLPAGSTGAPFWVHRNPPPEWWAPADGAGNQLSPPAPPSPVAVDPLLTGFLPSATAWTVALLTNGFTGW